MIYTITINPALDYIILVEKFMIGEINRSMYHEVSYGGKGINVSAVLHELSVDTTALGFIAGFTGDELDNKLNNIGIKTDFIKLKEGFTRINIKITDKEYETAVNASGPVICEEDLIKLYNKVNVINKGDVLVLAGSVPPELPLDIYERILARVQEKEVLTVVDAEKELLLNALKYNPFLVKPNHIELGDIFGKELKESSEIKHYARELIKMGAKNVLVSMGENGAILVTEDDAVFESGVIKGNVVNTVGAGDSMIAGFLAGYLRKKDFNYALALGTAAGIATAFSSKIASREEIYHVFDKMILW